MKINKIPTGFLFTDTYSKGELETLSIGDYGKHVNIKADFLGYNRELFGVPNTNCMPLQEKWVITLSTQYGCTMNCTFCDVPKIKMKGNATFDDLKQQFYSAIRMFPNVKYTERMNVHFARMGEPIFNDSVLEFAIWMYENKSQIKQDTGLSIETLHPVLTSSLPRRYKKLEQKIIDWVNIKNNVYNGQAGLQLSINSTDKYQRDVMFNGDAIELKDLAEICDKLPDPVSRKYCLNFAYASDFIIDADYLRTLFDPEKFMCKITPIHNNVSCSENGISTIDGYTDYHPYREVEESLKKVGYDVLVFIPSMDEESGLVTCGNLVLSGNKPVQVDTIKIIG